MSTDHYVMFGNEKYRRWPDARRYGFVSAGGGRRFSRPLQRLSVGDGVLVHVPGRGCVGVGVVEEGLVPARSFEVVVDGERRPLLSLALESERLGWHADDPDLCEYVVRVRWNATVDERAGYWRPGLFYSRTTAWPWPEHAADMAAEIRRGLGVAAQ